VSEILAMQTEVVHICNISTLSSFILPSSVVTEGNDHIDVYLSYL